MIKHLYSQIDNKTNVDRESMLLIKNSVSTIYPRNKESIYCVNEPKLFKCFV